MKPKRMAARNSCANDLIPADSLRWLSWCSKVGKVARMCSEVVTLVERILKMMARFSHMLSTGPLRNLLLSLDFPIDAKLHWELPIHHLEPVCVHASQMFSMHAGMCLLRKFKSKDKKYQFCVLTALD